LTCTYEVEKEEEEDDDKKVGWLILTGTPQL
jgi:hypothetical protein